MNVAELKEILNKHNDSAKVELAFRENEEDDYRWAECLFHPFEPFDKQHLLLSTGKVTME